MKAFLRIPAAWLFILSFIACNQSVRNQLDHIESIMDSQPDTALVLLEDITIKDLPSEESKARYALLKSMALDKNYIDVESDSLIRKAVTYYSVRELSPYRMKSWYYSGVVQANAGYFNTAIVSLERADHDAKVLGDYYYQGLINRKKASIYNALINTPAAIECSKTALNAFQLAGKKEHAAFCKLSLGIIWFNCHEYEKAKDIIMEAKGESDNPYLTAQCDLRLAAISVENNTDLDSALRVFDGTPLYLYDLYDYGYRAIAWELQGQRDSASSWMERGYEVANNEADSASLDYMYSRIGRLRGDFTEAFNLLDHANRIQEENTLSILQESLTSALKDYYKTSLDIEQAETARMRERRVWWSLITCLALIFLAVLFFYSLKRKSQQLEVQIARYQALQEDNRGVQMINKQLISSLFTERIRHLDTLSTDYYSADEKKQKDIVFSSFKHYLEDFRNDQVTFDLLEKDLNQYYHGLMERFIQQVPRINGDKRKISAMFFAGVPYETIQLIMGSVSIDSLRMLRSRIRNEIKNAHAPDADEFIAMLEIKKRTAGNKTNEC